MNRGKLNKFKVSMTVKILGRVFLESLAFVVAFVFVFVLGEQLARLWTWQGTEALYLLLKVVELNLLPFITLIGIFGFFVILLRSWLRVLGYLDEVVGATENIYSAKSDLILLSSDLKAVENQMNQIKVDIREKEGNAREAEQRKSDLIVYLAHDLKTPLTSVIGYLALLSEEEEISSELRHKYLGISLEKAEKVEDLINEFFEIARFNLSTLTLDLNRTNLSRMLLQLTYEFKPMLAEKNLECTLTIDPDVPISCDVDKMQRVFDNLLRNAVNYSFPDSTIEITALQLEEGLKISFLNHGSTIAKEKLDRIFDQFYRLDTARTTKNGGAGLGLAIAKEIVELHQGRIRAISENQTITVEVVLPYL